MHRRLQHERGGIDGAKDAIAERRVVLDELLELSNGQVGILQRTQELQVRDLRGRRSVLLGEKWTPEEESLEVREPVTERFLELVERLDVLRDEQGAARRQT